VKVIATILAGGVLGLVSLGASGVARADPDNPKEQEACQLMDDPAGAQAGYAPAEYAFMMLRAKMSAQAARDIMSVAAQEVCPNHIVDLPASWR
jgi:hypothetical protein